MPRFQKDFPKKDWMHYFLPASDEAFKKKYPIGYAVLVACGIGVFILPLVLLLLLTEVWYPAQNSGFLILAMVGCFIIGIGLFNCAAAWIGQYLGHWLTIGCFLMGGIFVSISLMIIYNPDNYALFDELMVTYYFCTMLFIALPPIFYLMFRFGVDSWLRRKRLSRTRLKKLKKGKKNFWWYEALQEQVGLGLVYHLNKAFTILYLVELVLALVFGWLRLMVPVVTGLYAILSVLLAGLSLFSSTQSNLDEFGTPIVMLRRTKNGGFTSFVFDLVMAAFPLAVAYAHVLVMLDALRIPR